MMANGALVRVLIRTSVTKYLNFKAVDGSFVYNKSKVWFLLKFQCNFQFMFRIEVLTRSSGNQRFCYTYLDLQSTI